MGCAWGLVSGKKFKKTSQNPNFSIIDWLFIEIIRLFLEFLLGINFFLENRLDISMKFLFQLAFSNSNSLICN
jgi:hypothetical protein